jgi:3-oxoacyl-[acyl-carrier protein] reductase
MGNIDFDFTGRTVIVTGAARGIGLELSRHFGKSGADVVMVDSDGEELARLAELIGAVAAQADVSNADDVNRVVKDTIDRTGRIDIMVNNAGILRDRVVWKLTDEDWSQVIDVHAGGSFRFTCAVIPHFRTQNYGRIINGTSYTGLRGNRGQANYATRMTASIPEDKIPEVTGPIARFADPSEMATAVVFLASEEAGYITGVVLPVDGGASI